MDKWLIIINPTAGGGKAQALEDIIKKELSKYGIAYEMVFTTRPKEAISIVENSEQETVVAVGGDGTVNEVARGIINRGYGFLGIIAGGTGNDLSRSLAIPKDPREAIGVIRDKKIKKLDVGIINGNKFFNIASAGFDGEVVRKTNKIKQKFRTNLAYILGVLLALFTYRKKDVILDIDGVSYERSLILLAVGNGRYYGGGLEILPEAKLDDGFLHICLVRDASNLTLLGLFPTIFTGKHVGLKKYVEIIRARKVKIVAEEGITINYDGEIRSGEKNIEIEMSTENLWIFMDKVNNV